MFSENRTTKSFLDKLVLKLLLLIVSVDIGTPDLPPYFHKSLEFFQLLVF